MDNIIRDSIFTGIAKVVHIAIVLAVCSAVATGQDRAAPVEANSMVYNGIQVTQDAASSPVLNKIISIHAEDVPLLEAVGEIAAKSKLEMVYNSKLLAKKDRPITLHLAQVTVEKALWSALEGTGLRFAVSADKQLVLLERKEATNPLRGKLAEAQETITGTVTDAQSGETLPGVNILVKGTSTGASTDADGQYELTVESLQDTLVVSFVGYKTQEVPINGRVNINVALQPQAISGEEMVVIGYGERKKETLTGSVSSVNGQQLQKSPVMNISNSLGGKLPGVITTTNSGEPGKDASSIRIRGQGTLNNNSPLVVIDGVPSNSSALDRLNPHDIENLSVLKDASAAIYGSEAANGVILVTTKRGKAGQEPQLTINFNQGFNQPTRIPEMADAATYLQMLNEIDISKGNEPRYSQEYIKKHKNIDNQDPWLYHDTDWFGETLKPLSYQTRGDMSMAGGSDNIQYRLSLGALTEDGYFKNSATHYNQYNFRSNINGQINKNLNLRFDVSGRYEDRNYPMQSTSDLFLSLMRAQPFSPAYWPDGSPAPALEVGQNPVIMGTDATGHDDDNYYFIKSNIILDADIPWIKGLNLRGALSYTKEFRERKEWLTPWILYSFNATAYQSNGGKNPTKYLDGSSKPTGQQPELTQYNGDKQYMLMNATAEYQNDFENHSIKILTGLERRTNNNAYFQAHRGYYISTAISQLFAGAQKGRSNDGSASAEAWLSYFSRINYDYQDKYLIELIGRYDGSYKFPKGDRFGFFPSISLGWRISEENFFKNNVAFFDELKIRASWGKTGNDRIEPYQYLASYSFGRGYVFNGDTEASSLYQTRTPNPNITWEVANQRDIGLEGTVLDNRFSFEVDYFNNLRTDILTQRNASIPQTSGLSLPEENIGEVSSYGVDGSLTWSNSNNQGFNYNLTLNAGWTTNKINYWDEPPGAPKWQQSTGTKMHTHLFYVADGIFNNQDEVESRPHWQGAQPGDIIFKDVNDDGEITADDRVRVERNNIPEWTGGLTLEGNYKQFDLTLFLQGSAGASQYLQTQSGDLGNYFAEFARKRWTPDHRDAEGPRAYQREEEYWIANRNTYFFRKTDYLRLKTLEFGYSLPSDVINSWGVKGFRVYLNGFNLLTWDTFKLMDPEASSDTGAYYPQKRVINVGATLKF